MSVICSIAPTTASLMTFDTSVFWRLFLILDFETVGYGYYYYYLSLSAVTAKAMVAEFGQSGGVGLPWAEQAMVAELQFTKLCLLTVSAS